MADEPLSDEERHLELESILKTKLRGRVRLKEAWTHASMRPVDGGAGNRPLAFVGDAVLAAMAARFLYDPKAPASKGDLTVRRQKLVSNAVLADRAKKAGMARLQVFGADQGETGQDGVRNLANFLEAVIGAVFLEKKFEATNRIFLRFLEWKR